MIPPVAALDAWLTDAEQLLGVRQGMEKIIRWRRAAEPDRAPLSVVYIHGYTASRQETAPLSDNIAKALDANLHYTRLKGHGLGGEDLLEVSLTDWMADVRQALAVGRRIGERQIIVASSTGATLTALAAARSLLPDSVAAMVFLSPNYGPADRRAEFITLPAGRALGKMLVGDWRGEVPRNKLQAKYWTIPSPTYALIPMMQGVKELRELLESVSIRVPTLTFYSPDDTVVVPEFIESTQERFTHELSRLEIVDNPGDSAAHLLAGDIMSPETTDGVCATAVEFIEQVLNPSRA